MAQSISDVASKIKETVSAAVHGPPVPYTYNEADKRVLPTLHLSTSSTAAAANTKEGSVYFIGNATLLIQFAGLNILTDPAFLHQGG